MQSLYTMSLMIFCSILKLFALSKESTQERASQVMNKMLQISWMFKVFLKNKKKKRKKAVLKRI